MCAAIYLVVQLLESWIVVRAHSVIVKISIQGKVRQRFPRRLIWCHLQPMQIQRRIVSHRWTSHHRYSLHCPVPKLPTIFFLLHLQLHLDRLLFVFASLVLEPDSDHSRWQTGHLNELFFHECIGPWVRIVAGSAKYQAIPLIVCWQAWAELVFTQVETKNPFCDRIMPVRIHSLTQLITHAQETKSLTKFSIFLFAFKKKTKYLFTDRFILKHFDRRERTGKGDRRILLKNIYL